MMKEFFTTSPALAWSIVSVMFALLTISILWTKIKWWWHNTWYSFPVIGKISSLSRDSNRDSTDRTWFKAEKTLCRDYKKFIRIQDEHDFNEKVTYITKAGDNGRRGTPRLIWVVTVALVFVEAMGFSYVLAGYTLPGASENMQQINAYGIAFLISVILVAFTHFAGHELYKSGKIKTARQEWVEGGRNGKTTTGTVPLARQQSVDDDQPGYVQLMNRVGTKASYYASIGTAIFVVIVAIGATYVRGQVLEKQLLQQVVGQSSSGAELSVRLSKDGLDMAVKESRQGVKLPAEDAAENQRASDKANADDVSIDRHGGWATFIILAIIFIFLQILSVYFGFRWGFAGKDSEAAYRAIGGGRYSSYSDVREHYKDIEDTAESKLEQLQQKIMERNAGGGVTGEHLIGKFSAFMEMERDRETSDRAKEIKRAEIISEMEKSQPANTYARESVVAAITEPAAETIDSAMQKLGALGKNKDAKKAYIQSLPDALKSQVMQELKTQKEQADIRARQSDADLDALLN